MWSGSGLVPRSSLSPSSIACGLAGTLTDAAHPRVAQDLGGKIVFSVTAGAQELHEGVCGLPMELEAELQNRIHVDGDITSVVEHVRHMTDEGGEAVGFR
jgi:hypothetical protein